MAAEIPTSRTGRLLSGSRTAAGVGGQMLAYYAKRPFLSVDDRARAREQATRRSAQTLFRGLSLLRGTALKMAQQLSLEMDLLPEAVCRELSKACHQVPPINRALVRKGIRGALGQPPEKMFRQFDLQAFAAASLGQVHRAVSLQNRQLAVKIQYPGIAATIDSDVRLLRQVLGPLIADEQLRPTLEELAARLHEEVDYVQEAENLRYFRAHLAIDGVAFPEVCTELSAATVLSTTRMPGKPLDVWIRENRDPAARNQVARRLNDLFLTGLYVQHVIHADPNPGNFIIGDDLTVGVVDFGCVKRLDPGFVEQYRRLARASAHHDNDGHLRQMIALGLLPGNLDKREMKAIAIASDAVADWFGRLYAAEGFDFTSQPTFIREGKTVMHQFHAVRRHLNVNPEFIFLDRTRYGLLRLFEMMGARVCFRNPYEW